jgi:hypothetical protein
MNYDQFPDDKPDTLVPEVETVLREDIVSAYQEYLVAIRLMGTTTEMFTTDAFRSLAGFGIEAVYVGVEYAAERARSGEDPTGVALAAQIIAVDHRDELPEEVVNGWLSVVYDSWSKS